MAVLRGRSSISVSDDGGGVGSPGAGTLGSGNRAHTADAVGALSATSNEMASTPHPSDR